MRFGISLILVFVTLVAVELTVNRLNPFAVHFPVIVPVVLVTVVNFSRESRSWFRTATILSILGGLAGETGSVLPPGVVLTSILFVTIIAASVSRRVVSLMTLRILAGILAGGFLLTHIPLIAIAMPSVLQVQPLPLFFRGVMLRVILPTLGAVLIGLLWQQLMTRPYAQRIARSILSLDPHL